MPKVEINGTTIDFDKMPSPEDIDHVASELKSKAPKTAPGGTWTSALLKGGQTLAGESFYQGVVRPAADLNRFGYSIIGEKGGLFDEPTRYKERRVAGGLYGATRLPEDTPHGFLEHLSAATSPFEGALVSTPTGRVIFGLGVAARSTMGDDVADTVEGTVGLLSLGRDLYRAGKLLRRKAGPFTPAERAYKAAKESLGPLEAGENKAKDAAEALQSRVTEAKAQAAAVASAAEDAAGRRVEAANAEHRAAFEHIGELESRLNQPVKEIRDKMGLLHAPTAEEAGKMLQAVDEDALALSTTGGPVGASAKAEELHANSEKLLNGFETQGKALGSKLPSKGSGSAAILRRRGGQYLRGLLDGQGSPAERQIGSEIAAVGIKHLVDPESGQVFKFKNAKEYRATMFANPRLMAEYEDVPIERLSQLWRKARTVELSPREFPVSNSEARRSYRRMVNSLRTTIGALADGDPELQKAWIEAQRHIRRVERPFREQVASRLLARGKSARGAVAELTAEDPSAIERYFAHTKTGAERKAITHSIFNELVFEHSNDDGAVDIGALAKRFKNLPRETQQLLVSNSNGATKMVIDEASFNLNRIKEVKGEIKKLRLTAKEASDELSTVRYRKGQLLKGLTSAQRDYLDRARKQVTSAMEAVAESKEKIKRLGNIPRTAHARDIEAAEKNIPVVQVQRHYGGGRMFGKAHVIMGLSDLMHGLLFRALLQGGEATFFLARRRSVLEGLETPITTPRGREIATALHVALQGYLGQPERPKEDTNGQVGEFRQSSGSGE